MRASHEHRSADEPVGTRRGDGGRARAAGGGDPRLPDRSVSEPEPDPALHRHLPGLPRSRSGRGSGSAKPSVFWTVRARVSTADQEAGYRLLLRLLDPNDEVSVETALAEHGYVMGSEEGVVGVPGVPGGPADERQAARLRMEGEPLPMTTYKVTAATGFQGPRARAKSSRPTWIRRAGAAREGARLDQDREQVEEEGGGGDG